MKIKVIGRGILLICGIFIGLFLSELLLLRLEKKGVIKIDRTFIIENRIFSNSMIYTRKPYSSNIFTIGENQNYWGINKYGFRDGDYSLKKPINTYRIVVLGDSIVAGGGVDASESFPKILESRLNKEGQDTTVYEVLNMGVNGYGPVNYAGLYKELAWKFSPDLVVIGFYLGGDPGNSISYKLNKKEIFLNSLPDTIVPYQINQYLKEKSSLWLFVLQKYYDWTKKYKVDSDEIMYKGDVKQHAIYDADIEMGSYIKEGWSISEDSFKEISDASKLRGTKFLILGIPARSAVDPDEWKRLKADGHNVDDTLYKNPASEKAFISMCQNKQLECLDLYSTLKDNNQIKELFLGTDNHFSYKGNWVVSDTLLNYLISNKDIDFTRKEKL